MERTGASAQRWPHKFVAPGSAVLDVGCGRMQLRDHLPQGCTYTPADLVKWSDEVHQVDLDQGEFPAGAYDYAFMLGIIEYLREPGLTLQRAHKACQNLIVSYCHPRRRIPLGRPKHWHWRNSYSEADFRYLLNGAGWQVNASNVYEKRKSMLQRIYACGHCE